MIARSAIAVVVGLVAAVAVAVALTGGDEESYRVRAEMHSANGLHEDTAVTVGAAKVGKVESLRLGRGDVVVAELALDPDQGRIGEGASLAIKAQNLLGDRMLSLDRGNLGRPRPSGATIPASRTHQMVDLDQMLSVLDPNTRTRLQILINETGLALTGRSADFSRVLRGLPSTLASATTLLGDVVADNRKLGELIEHADGFVHRLTPERRQLARAIDAAGRTMRAVGARRGELASTLRRAPGTLTSLQRFLADLRATTGPLGPAARALSATAPPARAALAELDPFRRAANPAFRQATEVAPSLTRLAARATPVVRRAEPTLRELASYSGTLAPLSDTLDKSIADVLGVVHDWARAIQQRDGISHVFHGRAVVGHDAVRKLLSQVRGFSDPNTRPGPAAAAPRSAAKADRSLLDWLLAP